MEFTVIACQYTVALVFYHEKTMTNKELTPKREQSISKTMTVAKL